ncbi:N-acetylmuramoyl-L-alanine amidase [Oceanobacillus limi]|uniref:N-acetylmuramoyl-L-alanine amidase n=1 Tax=Oceanobacillus limi TaxID=930131 RepID=A0A1I0HMJ8_9BACI|nr:N-acetylmuramoyl-L-alanine amidase [Oceanobacillus limi]SET84416.1 N-acetylmuramoyl-L-alanine amidase [Oceanobacillus limi]
MSKSLIIDPGHGGSDNGASGYGVREKDWTLKISKYQFNRLKELGADVHMTRTNDKTIDSTPRANLIKNKYDYCMSNHFNAFDGEARGIETIHSIYANDDIATQLADAIKNASGLPLRRVFSRRGKSGDYYYMHRLTGSTQTTIVEYGFIDNKEDHNFYKNEDYFYKVAEAIVKEWCSILGIAYKTPKKEGELTVDQYKELKKEIAALKKELDKKQNKPSDSNEPSPTHAKAWERAKEKGLLNGERPHHPLTREQFATIEDRKA